jgi:hypothetical protein
MRRKPLKTPLRALILCAYFDIMLMFSIGELCPYAESEAENGS